MGTEPPTEPGGPVPLALVVGAGGLLGSAVTTTLAERGARPEPLTGLAWSDHDTAAGQIRERIRRLATEWARPGTAPVSRLELYWCAGAGHIGASPEQLASEGDLLEQSMRAVEQLADTLHVPSTVVLASSAGGVWAGADHFPVSESTPPATIHAYGEYKLAHEHQVLERTGNDVRPRVMRISNLFGPRQSLQKRQGLLSHLVANTLRHRPTNIFVPLDTARDYIHVVTAARMCVDYARDPWGPPVRIVASGQTITIGAAIAEVGRVLKRRVPITLGSRPQSRFQPRVLAFETAHPESPNLRPFVLAEAIMELVQNMLGQPIR